MKRKNKKNKKNRTVYLLKLALIVIIFSSGINAGIFAYAKQITEKAELLNELSSAKIAQTKAENLAIKNEQVAEQERDKRVIAVVNQKRAEQVTKQVEAEKEVIEAEKKVIETEKRAKELELTKKDEEEKIMSADKDYDGLTYREELALGTSDYNSDSDYDGIPDGLDSHPAGGGRYIAQHFEWSYGYYDYTWDLSIHSDWYDYYKNKSRVNHGSEYVSYNDPYIINIANYLKAEADLQGYPRSGLAMAFVQSLAYVQDVNIGYDDYPKYPIETIIERNGDCEDTSYLAASIIKAMNIDVILIELPNHMAIGVWVSDDYPGSYYEKDGRHYYYYETTGSDWRLGEIPAIYKNKSAYLIDV